MRTFVIGDVHGAHILLQELLDRAGITPEKIVNGEVEVVQLGDLGDYRDRSELDKKAWDIAHKYRFTVLWGNHEAGIMWPGTHSFRGQRQPSIGTMSAMYQQVLKFAIARDGFLLTHAGLSPDWCLSGEDGLPFWQDPAVMATLIERTCTEPGIVPLRDAISPYRGGHDMSGGILWRDAREPLAALPQVFGHSRGLVRSYNDGQSFCLDVGCGKEGRLAGMWLDTLERVAVGYDAVMIEKYSPVEE